MPHPDLRIVVNFIKLFRLSCGGAGDVQECRIRSRMGRWQKHTMRAGRWSTLPSKLAEVELSLSHHRGNGGHKLQVSSSRLRRRQDPPRCSNCIAGTVSSGTRWWRAQ